MNKEEARKTVKARLADTPVSASRKKGDEISEEIIAAPFFVAADEVFVYAATALEPDLDKMIREALRRGKRVAFPHCVGEDEVEFFFVTDPQTQLKRGRYNIWEPDTALCEPAEYYAPTRTNRVIVCPGLGFDLSGNRLGRGKGYYDKFLAKHRRAFSHIAGACFRESLLAEIPTDSLDFPMDEVFFS